MSPEKGWFYELSCQVGCPWDFKDREVPPKRVTNGWHLGGDGVGMRYVGGQQAQ